MKVSVILPFFNAEDSLDAAVRSMLEQTFTDIELLLVDNMSSDRSGDLARKWAAIDQRVVLLEERQEGVAQAMNRGIQAANGQYIARMDADDVSHPDRIERQVRFLDENPDVGVLATQVEFQSELEHHDGYQHYVDWQNALLSHEQMAAKRFVDAPLVQPTTMFRKEVFAEHGLYNSGPVPEDFEMWLRLFHAGVRFAKLPEVLFTWNDSLGRLSRSHSNFSSESFDRCKADWMARFMTEKHQGRGVVALGTSSLCRKRASALHQRGVDINAFSDVSGRRVEGFAFIEPEELCAGEDLIVSFISQRGTGDRIQSFLESKALVEGTDFLIGA